MSVAIKEKEEGYVAAVLAVEAGGLPAGEKVLVKAIDYTSKGNSENIEVVLPGKKSVSVKKSDVKLFEAGVYNSEMDINNNPKTDENKPDGTTEKLQNVLDMVDSTIAHIQELKSAVDEGTSLSSESLEKCITELTTYKQNLQAEAEHSQKAAVSA
jgi:hypothetical protein